MKFDEVENLLLEQNLDDDIALLVAYEMSVLKETYAPTVEMTKEQAEDLNSIIREVGEVFEPNEIPADVKLTDKVIELESSYIFFKYLNAILHPETIKMVNDEEN